LVRMIPKGFWRVIDWCDCQRLFTIHVAGLGARWSLDLGCDVDHRGLVHLLVH